MKIFDTNRLWVLVTCVAVVLALSFHLYAQATGLYYVDWVNIDVYTHFFSSFAIACIILNLNLPIKKDAHWIIVIILIIVIGLVWEMSEEIVEFYQILPWIENNLVNAIQDLFQDVLGAVLACWICDKIVP